MGRRGKRIGWGHGGIWRGWLLGIGGTGPASEAANTTPNVSTVPFALGAPSKCRRPQFDHRIYGCAVGYGERVEQGHSA